jgi:hypothetical protein
MSGLIRGAMGDIVLQTFSLRRAIPALLALGLSLVLAGCSGGVGDGRRVSTASRPASRPVQPSPTLRQCFAKLSSIDVRFDSLPDRNYGGGCSAMNSVKLLDIGVSATNLGAMTCPLAANFAAWSRYAVQPAARLIFGTEIARIDTFGTYNCRPIAGSGKLSEHAHSNAVDVAAFVLADGRRITVKEGWAGDHRAQQFLKIVHSSACKRFNTVLSPDYNAAHKDHLHFDMGGKAGYCR